MFISSVIKKEGEKSKKKCFHNLNESSKGAHRKKYGTIKCHLCNKVGHYKKDCLKRKAWFGGKSHQRSLNFSVLFILVTKL